MRWLGWTVVGALGLTVGAGCRGTANDSEARRELRKQTSELSDAAARTAKAAGDVVKEEAPRVREELGQAAKEARKDASDLARELSQEAEESLTGTVSGTVASATEGRLQLRATDGKKVVLSTDGRTRVTREGKVIEPGALPPGAEVRASYVIRDDEWVARLVVVVVPAKR
jgi:hypothetical protein